MIAVCTYNEAENIELMVSGLRQALPNADVIVVDDNSPDGTAQLVREMAEGDSSIQVLVRENERGLGSAIRFAMQYSIDHGYDYFMNLDGDLSHSPDQMKGLFSKALEDSGFAVVVGSRYVSGGEIIGWPLRRKLMSRMVNGFATTCLRLPVRDCSGSMRCYRVNALASLGLENLRVNGYAVLEEVLLRLHQRGEPMAEVPITFTERERGYSKLTISEAMRSMIQIISLAFRPKIG
ncbi:MAG: glycosyl transferase [Rhodopirellula sp.]|nr:glycosyl transferase [Rhodopirellula sp.]MCP4943014.1 polyprenol monophosphomannose synthase [Planctomycetaceae bacterium]